MAPKIVCAFFSVAALMAFSSLAHHSCAAYDVIHTAPFASLFATGRSNGFEDLREPRIRKATQSHASESLSSSEGTMPERLDLRRRIITSSPAILKRFGWTQHSLKPGDRVSVVCNPMSDGSPGGRLHTVVLLDTGQELRTKLSGDELSRIE